MKKPNPPFLQLNFYYSTNKDSENLYMLTMLLIKQKPEVICRVSYVEFEGAKNTAFSSISTFDDIKELELNSFKIQDFFSNPNILIFKIEINDVLLDIAKSFKIITFLSISEDAVHIDNHPIAIFVDGEIFDRGNNRYRQKLFQVGDSAHKAFVEICDNTEPTYAAINVEYSIECKVDLEKDSRSYAFRDFFINKKLIIGSKIDLIKKIFDNGYIEQSMIGYYFSCTKYFNPKRIEFDSDIAILASIETAKILIS